MICVYRMLKDQLFCRVRDWCVWTCAAIFFNPKSTLTVPLLTYVIAAIYSLHRGHEISEITEWKHAYHDGQTDSINIMKTKLLQFQLNDLTINTPEILEMNTRVLFYIHQCY